MGKTERLYQLENALRAGKPILDAPGWARHLGVDLRTFQRYLRVLRHSRALPVRYDARLKGYCLSPPEVTRADALWAEKDRDLDLLRLVELLSARPGLSARGVAQRLDYSVRSFHRSRDLLKRMKIPIRNERGYRTEDRIELPATTLTAQEYLVVQLAIRRFQRCYPEEVGPIVMRLLEKLLSSSGKST